MGARGEAGYLLFSDIPANVIYMWNPLDDKVSVYLDRSGYTGQDIWRVGFMQTNGKDKSDPEIRGISYDRLERAHARPRGPADHRHLGLP